jgi:DNA-binding response OmpR family regulator
MAASGLVLFAEDDPKLRKLYSDALQASGYNVIAASDGDEAVELLHTVKPKIILLDVMMPRLSGIDACKRARKIIGSETPIIFLTALDGLDTVQECIAAGGDDFIMKSESVSTIVERVGHWMKRKPAREHLSKRRERVLADVVAEVNRDEDAFVLSSQTDEIVREISEFLRKARANAGENFGKTVKEKLYLLGYVTGVVEHWAELRKALADQFFDYLSAVLRETNVLAAAEISEMVAKFEELSTDTCFGIARAYGRNDPVRGEGQGEECSPVGLSQYAVLRSI